MSKKFEFEIRDHGFDHCQYFQGCGTAFTDFTHCFTGAGMDAVEAYNDALDQAYQCSYEDVPFRGGVPLKIVEKLPKRPRGLNKRMKVPATHCGEDSEVYWYVTILMRVPE